ncbi:MULTISPECIES: hypothetical protein [unclassified Lysobacter]
MSQAGGNPIIFYSGKVGGAGAASGNTALPAPTVAPDQLELTVIFCNEITDMIELNPVHERIVDLKDRLDALRGYL